MKVNETVRFCMCRQSFRSNHVCAVIILSALLMGSSALAEDRIGAVWPPEIGQDPTPRGAPVADIAVTQSTDPSAAVCDEFVTYTLTVTNNGPGEATMVQATNQLPECLAFDGFVSISQGAAVHSMGLITINFGAIGAGNSATLVFRAIPSSECTPSYENVVEATTTSDDSNLENNASTLQTLVGCGDLTVEKIGPSDAVCGDTVVYLLVARQAPPGDAGQVVVTDELPDCLTDIECIVSQGTCTVGEDNVVTAELGTLNAGGSEAIVIIAIVGEDCAPSISNLAAVSTPAPEPDTTNNTSDAVETTVTCVVVEPPPPLPPQMPVDGGCCGGGMGLPILPLAVVGLIGTHKARLRRRLR